MHKHVAVSFFECKQVYIKNKIKCLYENVPEVEFMYLVFTSMTGELLRPLMSLLLCLCDVVRALINSLVC